MEWLERFGLLVVLWLRALHLTSGGVAEIRGLGEQTGCRNVSFWFNEVEMFRGYRHGILLEDGDFVYCSQYGMMVFLVLGCRKARCRLHE